MNIIRNACRRLPMAALFAPLAFWGVDALAGPIANRNLPSACTGPAKKCGCNTEEISVKCIKVNIDLGETTPWTGSLECALKIFADNDSPLIFTADSLYAVLGGYTFKKLGLRNLSDGVTPAEVIFSHDNGEPIHFVFTDGESVARPDPGIHVKMDERLMMVDAEGWAATHDPVYYDLYVGDGTRRRFLATDIAGTLGSLVSITDARGVTVTPADMGVDVVYDANGVRQYMTPSRLADVARTADSTGYDVRVYALQVPPVKDAATGLYPVPNAIPVKQVSIRRENDGKRAVVSVVRGGDEPRCYVFDYVMGDWSLTRPSGVEERKERVIDDERAAQVLENTFSAAGVRLARSEYNYKWESWGFAMTNRVEGFGGVTDTTTWTYYTSGNGKGQVKTEQHQSGLLIQYAYDNLDRVTSESRSGPDMMTEVTTYDYMPVDPSDPVLPVDTRPRTVVRKLNNIECERTYYVYSPLTNIVERVGTQGAAYGGTNVLRTVTTFYPVSVGASLRDARSGFVASIRHEDGRLDLYDYELSSNTWIRTVTHLHEQSPAPVSGKTTRDITATNRRGEILEQKTDAYIDGIWYTIARNRMTYNSEGKRITSENLAGQVTTTAWDCCHKVSEVQPDGSTMTWDYDIEGRVIASSRLIPLDMTNVTWLTTCYRYDALGRQVATWQTNFTAQVGLPATRIAYDQLGRAIARIDQLGNTTTTTYSPDGRTLSVLNPNTSTRITTRSASGDILSISGTAVTPEFHTYGILPDGTRWSKTVQGETASSPRYAKSFVNLLGQNICAERSGFRSAVLASVNAYDAYGRVVLTTSTGEPEIGYIYDAEGVRSASIRFADGQWRRSETTTVYALVDGQVWLTETNRVACSDSSIAPLSRSSDRKLTGLTTSNPSLVRTTDIRGNATENSVEFSASFVTSSQIVPYATNRPLTISRYGVQLQTVSISAATNAIVCDALGRECVTIDGRGNSTITEYNAEGRISASVDAAGSRTEYGYNQFGELVSVADLIGNRVNYRYDIRGRKVYEGGATYPVEYAYDVFGNKVTMTTYRNEGAGNGDTTSWFYDEASGVVTNKVYADGNGTSYGYTADGKLSTRTWARGITTDYSYDIWSSLTNTVYSDDTPTISLAHDALGRQIAAHDAAGVTTFIYDSFGSLTNETVIGVAGTNTIDRFYDNFGRDAGYSLNGVRQSALAYDPATGRLATMQVPSGQSNNQTIKQFSWSYLPDSDLKSSLSYPDGLTASWQYDANGKLLQVCNATPTNTISQYDYVYDAAGRCISVSKSGTAFDQADTIAYGYNARSELTNAVAAVDSDYRYAYDFDDIGNRETSSERGTKSIYAANQLNQYAAVDDFTPQFDDDGNQTLVKTATGIWSVTYNGENRPILWTCLQSNNQTITNQTIISMSYDRMGRRVTKNNQRFIYNGYLQIANFRSSTTTSDYNYFIWDPTEPIATRPLVWNISTFQPFNFSTSYYTHDGNKNVSEIVMSDGSVPVHYEYTPFGMSSISYLLPLTPYFSSSSWRFSSEYAEDDLGLIYYNYRHYEPKTGRWCVRDFVGEKGGLGLYLFCIGAPINQTDTLGLFLDKEYQQELFYYGLMGLLPPQVGIPQMITHTSWFWQSHYTPKQKESSCRCGPEVADGIEKTILGAENGFKELIKKAKTGDRFDKSRLEEVCSYSYLQGAWDIQFPAVAGCGDSGVCKYTISVRGQCYWKWDVNYILFGKISSLCAFWRSTMEVLIFGHKTKNKWILEDKWEYTSLVRDWAAIGWSMKNGHLPDQLPQSNYKCQKCDKNEASFSKQFHISWLTDKETGRNGEL